MRFFVKTGAAAALAIAIFAPHAWAAAPAGVEPAPATTGAIVNVPAHELDTELVVHDWVLCVSQAVAEQLAHARESGVEAAHLAYTDLTASRSCGRFEEMRVILRSRVYASPTSPANVFAAEVMLSDNWASAFVVSGGLPEDVE